MAEEAKIIKTKRPVYLFVLVWLTVGYLLVECAFNARLLDIVSSNATPVTVEYIEFWGRILSGVAVALAVCGTVLFPFVCRRGGGCIDYAVLALIVSVPLVLLVFHGEKYLINTLSNHSSQQERKIAALLALASGQLRQGDLSIQGIDLDGAALHSPEGKSFIALFSPLVSRLPNADRIIERELDSLLRQAVITSLGTVEDFYHGPFAQSFVPLQERFSLYANAVNKLREAQLAIPGFAEVKWNNYILQLKQSGKTPNSVPASYHQSVRRQVKDSGIPVPVNWVPNDRQGFLNAFIQKAEQELSGQAQRQLEQQGLPKKFPLTLVSFDTFLLQSDIQAGWKKALGLPESARVANGMNIKQFEEQAFLPLRESLIAEKKRMLRSRVEAFKDGGEWEMQGKAAVRALLVPPIALFFSLLGVLVHVCKTSFYVLRLVFPYPRLVALANACLFAVLLATPPYFTNNVTNTDTYNYIEGKTMEKHPTVASAMRWIIHAQTHMYPVNDWIRSNLLHGIHFGAIVEMERK